jgi:threonine/homoserine/homoserine lactone efflux protein
MNDISYWVLFFSSVLILNIAPGPDLVYIISRTVVQGRKIGVASSAGVCTGALVHIVAAALGISAILVTSAAAFSVVKYLGAAYLVYLGVKAFASKGPTSSISNGPGAPVSAMQAFKQGILIDVLNPKVAIFFMAFLPQFVRDGHGHASLQILGLGLIVVLVAFGVEVLFVLAAGWTTTFFRNNQYIPSFLDRVLGSIFIGLGIRLALVGHRS